MPPPICLRDSTKGIFAFGDPGIHRCQYHLGLHHLLLEWADWAHDFTGGEDGNDKTWRNSPLNAPSFLPLGPELCLILLAMW